MATSSRMLTLLSLLQTRRDWPGAALADRLSISARTVRRDVDRLRELGYRIEAVKGPDGGYRLDAGTELPPLLFDDAQAVVLALALQTVPVAGTDLEEAAERARTTVRQVMPARLRHRIDGLPVTALPTPAAPPTPVDSATLLAVGAAIRSHETLRFDYAPASPSAPAVDSVVPTDTGTVAGARTGTGTEERAAAASARPPRRLEPHHLVTRSGRWYVVGWDADSDDWRIYRLDRLTLRSHTGSVFVPRAHPGGDVATFVSARFKGSDSADVWPCRGSVTLAAPASAVTPYARDGVVEDLGPDRCRLTLGAWSWVALAADLARFDADILDAHPTELRTAFAHLATRFAHL